MKKTSLWIILFILLAVVLVITWQMAKVKPTSKSPNSFDSSQSVKASSAPAAVELGTSSVATQLANPASVNCVKLGGQLIIQKRGDGGEYGLCQFEGNQACEEWALLKGACPIGGVRTTGFDTIGQKYCAWLGGSTLAAPNSVCTFKDGSSCPTIDLYNGTCSPKN